MEVVKTNFSKIGFTWSKELIQKLNSAKLLNINILQPTDTYMYVCVSGGYSMLMFKNFVLRNC